MQYAKSLLLHFLLFDFPSFDRYYISSLDNPTLITPLRIAIVAGIAPWALTISSTANAVSLFSGYSIPCVIIVDSKATTGFPNFKASSTSFETTKFDLGMMLLF